MSYSVRVREFVGLAVGVGVLALGLGSFLVPNHFIDGGVTGISMLLAALFQWPLGVLLAVVNLPFLWLGYRQLGALFAIKTFLGIAALSVVMLTVKFPVATTDKLLGAVFGGLFIGAGVGLALRAGGVLDGTEILAVILSKRTFATVGEIILALNIIIFAVAAFFLGVEPAMYSVLTYFTAFRTIDFLLHGLEAYNGVMIISNEYEEIRRRIILEMGRGVTVLSATGGFSAQHQPVLYCVVTRLELARIQSFLAIIDEKAFVVVTPVHEVIGGTIKPRKHP